MPRDNINPKPSCHNAKWFTHEADGEVCLQIELGRDYAVLLTCRTEEGPSVTLWRGSGEHRFTKSDLDPGETPDRFRQWIEEAQA